MRFGAFRVVAVRAFLIVLRSGQGFCCSFDGGGVRVSDFMVVILVFCCSGGGGGGGLGFLRVLGSCFEA